MHIVSWATILYKYYDRIQIHVKKNLKVTEPDQDQDPKQTASESRVSLNAVPDPNFFEIRIQNHSKIQSFYISWLLILLCARMMKNMSFPKKKSDLTTFRWN